MAQKPITVFFKRKVLNEEENGAQSNKCKSFKTDVLNEIEKDLSCKLNENSFLFNTKSNVECEVLKDFYEENDKEFLLNSVPTEPVFEEKRRENSMFFLNRKHFEGSNYNPAKTNYNPIDDAFWKKKENTPYFALSRTFFLIEETKSRLKSVDILSNFFLSVMVLNPEDLLPSVYLFINELGPSYEGIELNVSENLIMSVIGKATGRHIRFIKSQYKSVGDLSLIAEQSRVSQRTVFCPKPRTVTGMFQDFLKISKLTGTQKADVVHEIFIACRSIEIRFFVRALLGKLRIGVAEQTLYQSLAMAILKNKTNEKMPEVNFKNKVDDYALKIKAAFCCHPNYNKLISTLLQYGIDDLTLRCQMEPGVPIKPMLAQPIKSIDEVLQRLENLKITCEWKYDGERAQIHCRGSNDIKIYSRNLENCTAKYPDIVFRANNFMKSNVNSFIVDSEVVAWDVELKNILPFQILSTRKRKNVDIKDIKVNVCVFVFDLLYLNGESIVEKSLFERRQLLKQHFQEVEGEWRFVVSYDTNNFDELQKFFEKSVIGNCEGLMIKTLDSKASYEIAKRSNSWLKLKKDYISGMGDSLDLVVIGGYLGKGKRSGIFGGFLLACYDEENEEYQTVCKIGTGLSEEVLKQQTDCFKSLTIQEPKSYYQVDCNLTPDNWFEPSVVWEIQCANLSLSPVHRAAIGHVDPEKGISLRFPRFIRIRHDKNPECATSSQQIAQMFLAQHQIKTTKMTDKEIDAESFFY